MLNKHSPSQSDKITSMESMKFLNSAFDNDNICFAVILQPTDTTFQTEMTLLFIQSTLFIN